MSQHSDASPPIERGPWRYVQDPDAKDFLHRYFLESADFTHDVRLYLNGDFASDEQRRAYGEMLAQWLTDAAARS